MLRSFAIILVILIHVDQSFLAFGGESNFLSKFYFVQSGWIGVDLFFVLSGYLIGKQLLRELIRTGKINVGIFILRRGLRIWPLYFVVLAAFVLVRVWLVGSAGPWRVDALFVSNFTNSRALRVGWSLSSEEQFYLLAPVMLLLASRLGGVKKVVRNLLLLLMAILPIVRAAIWFNVTGGNLQRHDALLFYQHLYEPIYSHADGLVLGCLIALISIDFSRERHHRFVTSAWPVVLSGVVFLILHALQKEVLGFTGITVLFGAVTWFFLWNPRTLARVHDRWLFYLFSRLSYGMYLNHIFLVPGVVKWTLGHWPKIAHVAFATEFVASVLSVLVSAGLASLSFCLVEYPFLHLRDRLLPSRKPDRQFPLSGGRAEELEAADERVFPVAMAE